MKIKTLATFVKSGFTSLRSGYAFHEFIHNPQWPFLSTLALLKLENRSVCREDFVAFLTGAKPIEIERAFNDSRLCIETIINHENRQSPTGKTLGGITIGEAEVIYAITRLLKPVFVVETGVAQGISSTCILQAMHDNEQGDLYSIDLPPNENKLTDGIAYHIPQENTGWIIPPHLKYRWHLILGDAAEELAPLLQKLGTIDMFIHDSLHTLKHMRFEYRTSWPSIRTGGILLSHDARLAFVQFTNERKIDFVKFGYFGGTVKPPRQSTTIV